MENRPTNPIIKKTLGALAHELNRKKIITSHKEIESLEHFKTIKSWYSDDQTQFFYAFLVSDFMNEYRKSLLIEAFMKLNLNFDEAFFVFLVEHHLNKEGIPYRRWQVSIKKMEQFIESNNQCPDLLKAMEKLSNRFNSFNFYEYSPKIEQRLHGIINTLKGDKSMTRKPFIFDQQDDFGEESNVYIKGLMDSDKILLFAFLHLAITADGGKPTAKLYASLKTLKTTFSGGDFQKHIKIFLKNACRAKLVETSFGYPPKYLFLKGNATVLKGIIWASLLCYDKEILQLLAQIIDKSYQKIAGIGPAAAAVGNAALYVLANVEGLDGVNYLSRLKLKIKQANTQTLIERYLNEAAELRQVSKLDLEDIANDDFGLNTEGVRTDAFGDYTAELHIVGMGKTEIKWLKPDGSPQKTEPSFVKTDFAETLKALKNDAKQIQTGLTTQRDRLDRIFRLDRKVSLAHFKTFYLEHGLMSFLTHRLIWTFHFADGQQASGIFMGNSVLDENGEKFAWNTEGVQIGLWHPALQSIQTVQKWRTLLAEFQIQQPLKQAYREVYWLTDAEINTGIYSNRFAAHILKQHQFNSLAKTRGWRYSLLGAYDKGYESEIARLDLPEYGLRAEFWVSEVDADGAYNNMGIWDYVSTDQVRFHNLLDGHDATALDLRRIPKLLFSEVLRDVDLFVGVASVGNDPEWRDNGGLLQFRNYWESYSFGNLNETAKLRKSILEKILPKLKIAKVAHIEDKFLVVKGTFRSYKIHLGSTNILMTPNDQYLCIVADRSKPKDEGVFLPFEGDAGLSVIISKAILLAADDKITDVTITRQIHHRS